MILGPIFQLSSKLKNVFKKCFLLIVAGLIVIILNRFFSNTTSLNKVTNSVEIKNRPIEPSPVHIYQFFFYLLVSILIFLNKKYVSLTRGPCARSHRAVGREVISRVLYLRGTLSTHSLHDEAIWGSSDATMSSYRIRDAERTENYFWCVENCIKSVKQVEGQEENTPPMMELKSSKHGKWQLNCFHNVNEC